MPFHNLFELKDKSMAIISFALDNVHESIFLINNKGDLTFTNDEACRTLEYSRDEILSLNVTDVDAEFNSDIWDQHWKELKEKKTLTFESKHRTKNGNIIPVEINANYFIYDKNEYNLAFVRDITERKENEEKEKIFLDFLTSLDRISNVIQKTNDIDEFMTNVLDEILSIFECDRAYFLLSLEKDNLTWCVPKFRFKENYIITPPKDNKITLTEESREKIELVLKTDAPVSFTQHNDIPKIFDAHNSKSNLIMPLFTKLGNPWILGLEICSSEHIWTLEEKETFENIGRKITDALSTLLINRDLRISEAKYRQLIETSNEGILILDVDENISFVNNHMCHMLGYSEEEILGNSPLNFILSQETDNHKEKMENRRRHISEKYERQFVRKNGEKICTIISASPLFNDTGEFQGSFAMITDITDRKKMEDALRESEWRYREIFDNVTDGMYLLEVTDDGHFRNLEMNLAFEKSTGFSRDQLIGKIIEETVSPEAASIVNTKYRHCIEAGHPIEEEVALDLPIGKRYYHSTLIPARDENGKIYRIIGISRDITEKRLAEGEILKLNRIYKTLASCNESLVHAKAENELLFNICKIIVEQGGYKMAWVGYAENDEELNVKPIAFSGFENGYLGQIKISWGDNKFGRGPTGTAIRSRKYMVMNSFSNKNYEVWKEKAESHGYASSAAFPLLIDHKVLGALNIYSEFQNAFDESECNLLQELANDLAYGITSIRTRIEREDVLKKLNEAEKIARIGNWEYLVAEDKFYWSEGIYNIFEIEKEKIKGSMDEFFNLIHPEDKDLVNFTFENSIKTKTAYTLDHRLLFPSGRIKYVHVQGETNYDQKNDRLRTFGTTQDVTESKLIEQEKLNNLLFVETLDKINRVIQSSEDLNQMMMNVLDIVLSIFDCDRSFLLYPCDPTTPNWTVPMERTKPEYPGLYKLKLEIPIEPHLAEAFKIVLESSGPVKFGPNTDHPLHSGSISNIDFKSILAMAIYPKFGKPWQFGMHQCSYAREWSDFEVRLFGEIGRRIEDSLTALLIFRDLQLSEERYRMVFENSPVSLWEEDLSEVKIILDELKSSGVTDLESYLVDNPEVIKRCFNSLKIIDVNRAALILHGASKKEELLNNFSNFFTQESFITFRKELISIWNGKLQMSRDSVIKTITGEFRSVTVFFSVCLGYEDTLSRVIVSITDITDRKEMESNLRKSEERYKSLYNNTPVMLHSINNEGKLISVSDYWLDTMGYSREEVIGHNSTEFLTKASSKYAIETVLPEFMKTGICHNIEYQFIKKNGEIIDCILSAISEQGSDGSVLRSLAVITDITELKKAEKAVRESEEKYRTLIEKIQAAVVVHSSDTSIITSNSMAEKLLGLTKVQIKGKTSIDSVWHFSDENGKYISVDKYPVNLVLSSGEKLRNHVFRIHRPGLTKDIWVLVNADPVFNNSGDIIQVIVTFIDITARKKIEVELEEERKLFIGGPNVAFKWKAKEGWPIEYVSPNIAEQFGYSPEYLINGKIKYLNMVHENDWAKILVEVEKSNANKLPYFDLEYRVSRADGEYRWVYNFTTVVRTSSGTVTHYQGHIVDITEDKRVRDEIQKLNLTLEKRVKERTSQLELLNKELEAFSYSVSHDLRTPLYHIDGYIGQLKEHLNLKEDSDLRNYIESISKSTRQMNKLIVDILSFSRLGHQELHYTTINMAKLVNEIIHDFEPEIRNRVVEWNISNLPFALGDKSLLRQVIFNFVSNALKFTKNREKAIINIGFKDKKSELIFFIKDNGAGFDMKFKNKLFEAFSRLHSKNDFEGTGVGLANVHRIITRHGGRTWAEGEIDKGATFYFSLPKSLENKE